MIDISRRMVTGAVFVLILFILMLASLIQKKDAPVKDKVSKDIVPARLGFLINSLNPNTFYFNENHGNQEDSLKYLEYIQREFNAIDATYFPYYKDGDIHPPEKYGAEERYSKGDLEKIRRVLKAAYRYANINEALKDGYRIQPVYRAGMGIHLVNLEFMMKDTVNLDYPEFLAYIKSNKTERFQLAQVGFIRRVRQEKKYDNLFETQDAKGHIHAQNACVREMGNIVHLVLDRPCVEKGGDHNVGPIWMMHVAVNLYNQGGIFSDRFPLVDYLSLTGETYSFFGNKIEE